MEFQKTIELLKVHCDGELGNVAIGGLPEIPGETMLDKLHYLNSGKAEQLCGFLTLEPRGTPISTVNLVLPPTREDADAGLIVLQAERAHAMSGSNSICTVTALLESGRLPMVEPETIVRLDTAAGLVVARAHCEDGRVKSVSIDNVPAFALALDAEVQTEQWGTIKVDISFGGLFYALIDVEQIGLTVSPKHALELAEYGVALREVISSQVKVSHPDLPGLNHISFVMWRGRGEDGALLTCTTLPPGRVDRSPCGTGSSANLAAEFARGSIQVGGRKTSRSITGGEFVVEALGETSIGEHKAVLPRVTGSAWVYGSETLRIDTSDPFPSGFALTDVWEKSLAEKN